MQKIMKNISAFLTLFSQGFLLNAPNELNQYQNLSSLDIIVKIYSRKCFSSKFLFNKRKVPYTILYLLLFSKTYMCKMGDVVVPVKLILC